MFFILSKLLLVFLSPFLWFIVCVGIFFYWPNSIYKRRARMTGIIIFFFFSNSFIFNEFCRQWEVHGTPIDEVRNYEVGIVLGGMAEFNNDIGVLSIRRGGDRIWQAISLYKKGKIKKILLSGDNGYLSDKGLHESEQFREVLIQWGIPAEDIIVEAVSKNTHENALETRNLLTDSFPKVDSCLLITSGSHMRRAMACFQRENVKVVPYSTDLYTGPERSFYWDQLLVPSVDTFTEWNFLIKEWVGYIAYDLVGYI
jgi:uncharacterized SAM-binding protein YcdF (DUF218 family)